MSCAFCRPGIEQQALWESEHYRVLADEYPRCAGHVLLVTKEHFPSHMSVPETRLAEFEVARERVARFLLDTFGKAAFYENGGRRQEVPHAHLHGLPFDPVVDPEWEASGKLERIGGWRDARQEWERAGHYYYLGTRSGSFLVREYRFILDRLRTQLIEQSEATLDPETGEMRRGGPEVVARTREFWHGWRSAHAGAHRTD